MKGDSGAPGDVASRSRNVTRHTGKDRVDLGRAERCSRGVSDLRREAGAEKRDADLSNVAWQHTYYDTYYKLSSSPLRRDKKTDDCFGICKTQTLQICLRRVHSTASSVLILVQVTSYLSRAFFAARKGRMSCERWWWACTSRGRHIAPPTAAIHWLKLLPVFNFVTLTRSFQRQSSLCTT